MNLILKIVFIVLNYKVLNFFKVVRDFDFWSFEWKKRNLNGKMGLEKNKMEGEFEWRGEFFFRKFF